MFAYMETKLMRWTVWVGLCVNGLWMWEKAATRKWSTAAKSAARRLAREHAIKSDFGDYRAVAYGSGDWKPNAATLIFPNMTEAA
jgi:hypothetical protein